MPDFEASRGWRRVVVEYEAFPFLVSWCADFLHQNAQVFHGRAKVCLGGMHWELRNGARWFNVVEVIPHSDALSVATVRCQPVVFAVNKDNGGEFCELMSS